MTLADVLALADAASTDTPPFSQDQADYIAAILATRPACTRNAA